MTCSIEASLEALLECGDVLAILVKLAAVHVLLRLTRLQRGKYDLPVTRPFWLDHVVELKHLQRGQQVVGARRLRFELLDRGSVGQERVRREACDRRPAGQRAPRYDPVQNDSGICEQSDFVLELSAKDIA